MTNDILTGAAKDTDDILTDSEVKNVKEKLLEILNGIKQI